MKNTKSKTKYLKMGLGVIATAPFLLVALVNQEKEKDTSKNNGEISYSSLYTPGLSVLPGIHKSYNTEEKSQLDILGKYGHKDVLHTKLFPNIGEIESIFPDGQGGFFVGGSNGKLDHVDAKGNLITGWSTKTIVADKAIHSIISDGQGGFFVGGDKLYHLDQDGEAVVGWTPKPLLGGEEITSIVPDGNDGFFVGGFNGKLDHIDSNGDLLTGWTTKTYFGGTASITSIVSDDQGGFFIASVSSTSLTHIDANGELVFNWDNIFDTPITSIISDGQGGIISVGFGGKLKRITAAETGNVVVSKTLLSGVVINSILTDGQGGFFVGGENGKIDHIDVDGELVTGWTTKTFGNGAILKMVPDGQGGFFVGMAGGELKHLDANGELFGFNSWVKGQYDFDRDYNNYKDLLSKDWTTQIIFENFPIYSMASDGQGGFFAGGLEGKVRHISKSGELDSSWGTKVLIEGAIVQTIVSDGQGGAFVGGFNGKLDHIDSNGDLVSGWTTKTFLDGQNIYIMVPDGQGGFFVGGVNGKFDHIDANGDLVSGWTTKTLLDGENIFSIVSDGKGGFFVSGNNASLDHIDASGELVAGWTTKTYTNLNENVGIWIASSVPDGKGGLFLFTYWGKIGHIDENGIPVEGFNVRKIFSGSIMAVAPDGQGGFFLGGDGGLLERIDANGDPAQGWTTKTFFGGAAISEMAPDGQGGFFIASKNGKIEHLDSNGDISKEETEEQTKLRWKNFYPKATVRTLPILTGTNPTTLGGQEGSISVNEFDDDQVQLQYREGITGPWLTVNPGLDITNLNAGTYNFRWVTPQWFGAPSISNPWPITLSDPTSISPVFSDLVTLTEDAANGGTTLAQIDTLPTGITSIALDKTSVAAGATELVTVTITYADGYAGPATISQNITSGLANISPTFDQLVTSTLNVVNGGTTLAQSDTLPTGVTSITLDKTSVAAGVTETVVVTVTYDSGHTGPTTIVQDVTGASINITPTFDELVTSTEDTTNGGTTLAQIDTLPTGVSSITLDKTRIAKGVIESVTAIVNYEPGFSGSKTISKNVTGALISISPTFGNLVNIMNDAIFLGSVLSQKYPLPIGVSWITLDRSNVEAGLTRSVTTTINYDLGYTGPESITLDITAPLRSRTIFFDDLVSYTKDDINGGTTLVQKASLPDDVASIVIDKTNIPAGTTENVTISIVYASGYTGSPTVNQNVQGGLIKIFPTFGEIVTYTSDTVNGGTTLAQIDTLPTGVSSITLDKTYVPRFNIGYVVATITYDPEYSGPATVAEYVTGASKAISPTFDQLVTSTPDTVNGGTTLAQIDPLPEGVTLVTFDKTSVAAGATESVTIKVDYRAWWSGPTTIVQDVVGAPINITPTFDQLVTSTEDTTSGGTTLAQNIFIPEGIDSIALDKTSVAAGTTESVTVTITYATGYAGPTTIVQDLTGALANINPTFDQLVTSTPDTVNGGTTLAQSATLPNGVASIALDKTSVAAGTTESVTVTITYATGYTGPTTVAQDIVGGSTNITPTFDQLVTSTEDTTSGGTTLAQIATLPTGVASIALDKTSVAAGTTESVTVTITYATGYAGPATIVQDVTGALINITPTFDQLITFTPDTVNGGTTLAQSTTLPTGITSITLSKTSISFGKSETVVAVITYDPEYTGPSTVTSLVTGASKTISPTFDELVTSAPDTTSGGTTLAQSATLPTGVTSITLDKTSVVIGVTESITATITYTTGYTGPSTVTQDVTGASLGVNYTFDELVTSTDDTTSGGTTLAQIDPLPTGVTSIILDKTNVRAGVTESITATITYATGYMGPATVTQDVTGAPQTISHTFDELVTSTPDTVNGGTTLAQIATLPTGVGSIILDKTKVAAGTTETVTATINYLYGYAGQTTVAQDVTGAIGHLNPTFDELVTSTPDTVNGGTTLAQSATLPNGVASIALDKTSVAIDTTESVTVTITYATGYVGPATVTQDVTGASISVTPTFDELVTSTENTTSGGTTLAQSATLPTGVSSIALDKTNVAKGVTESVTATVTYTSGYTGPTTVAQDVTGALANINPTFDELVTSTPDTKNGGTTLSVNKTLPIGVASVVVDKTKVAAGKTETVTATVTYTSGYSGLNSIIKNITGTKVTSSSNTTTIVLAVVLPILILPLLGFAGYKLFKKKKLAKKEG